MNDSPTLGRKAFFKMAVSIAMPIMVQNLMNTLVNTADTVMLGYVGQTAMSASSLAGNVGLVMWMAFNGIHAGAAVLGAQYWGKKDLGTIERVLGIAVRFCCGIGLLFWAASFFFPGTIMSFFTNDADIVAEGTKYLRIVSFSYLLSSFSMTYFAIQRSMEKAALPSVVYVISLCVNVFLNATFIFGWMGLPKLGLVGVALGTVAARAVECIICLVHNAFSKDIHFRFRYVFAKAGILVKDFVKLGFPAFVNDVVWSLAYSMYSVILGHMGSDVVAANAVANMAVNIGAIVMRGFANATTIIIGKALGEDDKDKALTYANRMVLLTTLFGIAGGIIIILIRPIIINIYADSLTATALSFVNAMMAMQAYRMVGEGVNTCLVCGCFRGGGDSKFGMIADTLGMWLMALPLTAIAAYIVKLPMIWVYFVMTLDEFEKMPIFFGHYFKRTWLQNITRDKAELEA